MVCGKNDCLFSRKIRDFNGNAIDCCHYILDVHESVQPYKNKETGECKQYTPVSNKIKNRTFKLKLKKDYYGFEKYIREVQQRVLRGDSEEDVLRTK